MKKGIAGFIIFTFFAFNIIAKENVNVLKTDFFGLKLEQNYYQMYRALKKQKKKLVSRVGTIDNEVVIEPDMQDRKGKKLDIFLHFFDKKFFALKKYYVDKNYEDYLIKNLGKNYQEKIVGGYHVFKWNIGVYDFEFSYLEENKNDKFYRMFVIYHTDNYKEYLKERSKLSFNDTNVIYIVNTNKLKIYFTPSLKSKINLVLEKGELLSFVEEGEEVEIDGKLAKWIKVMTANEESGWCQDLFLDKITIE